MKLALSSPISRTATHFLNAAFVRGLGANKYSNVGEPKMTSLSRCTATMLLLSVLTGVCLGDVHAAPVYVVDEVEITDPAVYKIYVARQVPLIKSFGGRFVVQGGATNSIEGAPPAPRVVIYVFENAGQLQAWRDGPEENELIAMRDRSSHFRSFSVEGLPN